MIRTPRQLRIIIVLSIYLVCGATLLQAQQSIYEIGSIIYDIDGDTRPSALKLRLENFVVGNEYPTRDALDTAIDEQTRILSNLRQLESVTITYTLTPRNGRAFADVTITIVDSGSFVVLPRPKYSSDDGGELGLRIVEYNFLGTLEQLSIAVDAILPNDNRNMLLVRPSVLIPFQFVNLDWYWQSDLSLEAPLGDRVEDIGVIFNNAIGFYFPVLGYRWNLEYQQGAEVSLDPADDLYFLSSRLTFGAEFSTAVLNDLLGRLQYLPSIVIDGRYRFEQEVLSENRGVDFSFNHTLGFDRINWQQNLREGIRLVAINNNTYNTFENYIDTNVGLEFVGHLVHGILGVSGRLGTLYFGRLISDTRNIEDVGTYGRGIGNSRARGNIVAYSNFDIRLASFKNGDSIEVQGGVFVDAIVALDTSLPFNFDEHAHLGVGVEGLGFLLQSRSVFLRLSIGIDILQAILNRNLFGDSNLEIFFGFGHHY